MTDIGKAAQARRYYLHVKHGGTLTPSNVSMMVKSIEDMEAYNVRLWDALSTMLHEYDRVTLHHDEPNSMYEAYKTATAALKEGKS